MYARKRIEEAKAFIASKLEELFRTAIIRYEQAGGKLPEAKEPELGDIVEVPPDLAANALRLGLTVRQPLTYAALQSLQQAVELLDTSKQQHLTSLSGIERLQAELQRLQREAGHMGADRLTSKNQQLESELARLRDGMVNIDPRTLEKIRRQGVAIPMELTTTTKAAAELMSSLATKLERGLQLDIATRTKLETLGISPNQPAENIIEELVTKYLNPETETNWPELFSEEEIALLRRYEQKATPDGAMANLVQSIHQSIQSVKAYERQHDDADPNDDITRRRAKRTREGQAQYARDDFTRLKRMKL